MMSSKLAILDHEIAPLGLVILAAFCPKCEEKAVPGQDSQPGTIVMVGNAGSAMWTPFDQAREKNDPDAMNKWTQQSLQPIADSLNCDLVFPFAGPPWYPFVSWAERSGNVVKSPLGMGLHREYGLFHAHRGAFLFKEILPVAARKTGNPCQDCVSQPCLSACPVSAFGGKAYNVAHCKSYMQDQKVECWTGCLARKACPIGQDCHYSAEHARYHMQAFMNPDINR
ncbi:MAG: hypothetical protein OIF54_16275 [Cohaesibacter sp.]|nr:hypothetical protein [Cohaesibacter sp.]